MRAPTSGAFGDISPNLKNFSVQSSIRRELFEVLDRIVTYEHYYHSVYGSFTQLLSRIGIVIPREVGDIYEIRVAEASSDRFLVTAFSEAAGKTFDLVTVNQDFDVHSEFQLPVPRGEFLRNQAQKHLRNLRNAPAGLVLAEPGIFKGYFKYETRHEGSGRSTAFAKGIQAPVLGVQIEADRSPPVAEKEEMDPLLTQYLPEVSDGAFQSMGQKALGNIMTTQEEAVLAQKIFLGEMGRYARDWNELARITQFRFEGRDLLTRSLDSREGSADGLEVGTEPVVEALAAGSGTKSRDSSRKPSAVVNGLEIEAISGGDSL